MLPTQEPITAFACLKLSSDINRQLDKLGFVTPTPIQAEAIPHALAGRDVIGIAQTGTGKTFAFGLPMIQHLLNSNNVGLILAPTRELALQIDEELKKIGATLGIKTAVLIGGAPMNRQVGDLRRRPNVIVATPGRLKDHLYQRTTHLKAVSMVVLDEADRMLDMGFAPAVKQILDQAPIDRQTMLFSATMAKEVTELASQYLKDPIRVEVAPQGTPSELVDQEVHVVGKDDKSDLLSSILDEHRGTVLVFSRTRHGARKVARNVRGMGHSAAELHSDRTLAQRKAALAGFKSGEFRVLVATDIAARGIDVKEIGMVVNYDLPDCIEDYVHRIGRTGRAGSAGKAVTFAMPEQHRDVRQIEKLIGKDLVVASGVLPAAPVRAPRPRPERPQRQGNENRPYRSDRPTDRPRFERPARASSTEARAEAPREREDRRDFTRADRPYRSDKPTERPRFERPGRANWTDRKEDAPRERQDNRDARPDRPYKSDRPTDRPRFERPARPNWTEKREDAPRDRRDSPRPDRPYKSDRPRFEKPTRSNPANPKPVEPIQSVEGEKRRPRPNGTPKKFQAKPAGKLARWDADKPRAEKPKSYPAKDSRPGRSDAPKAPQSHPAKGRSSGFQQDRPAFGGGNGYRPKGPQGQGNGFRGKGRFSGR